jgi:hypothetical protein
MYRHERQGVIGGWRKLHNQELHNLYFLPIIIMVIKSRRMRRLDMQHTTTLNASVHTAAQQKGNTTITDQPKNPRNRK